MVGANNILHYSTHRCDAAPCQASDNAYETDTLLTHQQLNAVDESTAYCRKYGWRNKGWQTVITKNLQKLVHFVPAGI